MKDMEEHQAEGNVLVSGSKSTARAFKESPNHSMAWVGRDIKIILFQPPAMDRHVTDALQPEIKPIMF